MCHMLILQSSYPSKPAPRRDRRRGFLGNELTYCREGAGDGCGAAGVNGCGDVRPEPVVVGGLIWRVAVPVVAGDALLFAELGLLFQPAINRNAISARTARPAIQPQVPPTPSSRRSTGSLNRGSVKRGSLMAILLRFQTGFSVSMKQPTARCRSSEKIQCSAMQKRVNSWFSAGTC